ncbi:MAG TPA: ROK family protein [Rhizomicrobium sp.]|nr:ROK family protein [Rhizomicrobium sp.]
MRLGIDLGGTKIEIAAIGDDGRERLRERVPTPVHNYGEIVIAITSLVRTAEERLATRGSVGVAIPGTISARTGLVKNANSTVLNGRPLDRDLETALKRPIRMANDANCFTLSESTDGAAAGRNVVFGVIAGTGVGGGVCVGGRLLEGPHRIAGEWGHNPLPAPRADELAAAPSCYCGRNGCIETWISGPALARDFNRRTGRSLQAAEIHRLASDGDSGAIDVMEDFLDRFARAMGSVINILDPDAVVLGGGLSNLPGLAGDVARCSEAYTFMPETPPLIVKNAFGDSSGVRGAAWLWRTEEVPSALPR